MIRKLNWRQIAVHLAAGCFFMYAFYLFSYLMNTELVALFRRTTPGEREMVLITSGKEHADLVYFILWRDVSLFIGLLVAFAVSLGISLKHRWFWMNSLVVFLSGVLILRLAWLGTDLIGSLTFRLGQLLDNLYLEFIVSGGILLLIGLLLFFSRRSRRFIAASPALQNHTLARLAWDC